MNIRMVQIRFTPQSGGGMRYYKVTPASLVSFAQDLARGTNDTITLQAVDGTIHHFPRGSIREYSERPYDPNHAKRRREA